MAGRDDLVSAVGSRAEVVRGKADSPFEALLIRPDGYVAWTSEAGDAALPGALDRWNL
ncbi:hypothetical protein ACFQGX_30405 [Nonomuraea dietziae]|uniref:aromatic-ring hydroxylase C-terminal domain-containing protein n=1 Tax=Nonomuraea dietziae TaxID=65515 RepID=UPI003615C960